jgi:hypothetical protein
VADHSGHSDTAIVASNPAEGMGVCPLLSVLYCRVSTLKSENCAYFRGCRVTGKRLKDSQESKK